MKTRPEIGVRAAVLVAAALAVACTATSKHQALEVASRAFDAEAGRMMVRTGDLTVSVGDTADASREVERLVRDAKGYVERSSVTGETSIRLRCRVPAPALDRIMDDVAALGDEERRSLSAADVTEQHSDLATRLRNSVALRDRLRQLLERAEDVDDVLAVEKELTRVQSDVETMQARLDRLESEVELSVLSVTLGRKRILGPLGYVAGAVVWVVSKLFVIQ